MRKWLKRFKSSLRIINLVTSFPADLRRYYCHWYASKSCKIIRPDLIDEKLFGTDKASRDKFQEVEEFSRVPRIFYRLRNTSPLIPISPDPSTKGSERSGRSLALLFAEVTPVGAGPRPTPLAAIAHRINLLPQLLYHRKSSLIDLVSRLYQRPKVPRAFASSLPNSCVPDNWTKVTSAQPMPPMRVRLRP